MKTISKTLLAKLVAADFEAATLIADGDARKELALIDPAELDELIERITKVKPLVIEQREKRQEAALNALQSVIDMGGWSGSIEELIAAASGKTGDGFGTFVDEPEEGTKSPAVKKYALEIFDPKTGTTLKDEISNYKLIKRITDDERYIELIRRDPSMEDVGKLLRKYSPNYKEENPVNAVFKEVFFYCSDRGRLNTEAAPHFEAWQKHMKMKATTDKKELQDRTKQFRDDVTAEYKDHVAKHGKPTE